MKIRRGFVSNSSSSSFILNGDNKEFDSVFDIAVYMIGCRDYGEGEDNENKKLIEKLEKALEKQIITKNTNLMFHSCNYDTYIIKDYNWDKIYICTCNNHDYDKLQSYYDGTEGELCDAKRDNSRFYYIESGVFMTYLPYDTTYDNRRCKIKHDKTECFGEIFKADDGNNYCIQCQLDKFKVKSKERKKVEKDLTPLFDLGINLMKEVIKIGDKLYEVDEIIGDRYNEAIHDEKSLRS